MIKYYTRACNFYYGSLSKKLIKKGSTLPLCGNQFISFDKGIVNVKLKGSCSGCPSSTMTLKQGVQNLLCHYVKEVKSVEAT